MKKTKIIAINLNITFNYFLFKPYFLITFECSISGNKTLYSTMNINQFNNIFFIGVAGSGMSAIAQYLRGIGKNVSGSDRYFLPGTPNETREKLETEGIQCFLQDGSGITAQTDLVVASTAIEDTVFEVPVLPNASKWECLAPWPFALRKLYLR